MYIPNQIFCNYTFHYVFHVCVCVWAVYIIRIFSYIAQDVSLYYRLW